MTNLLNQFKFKDSDYELFDSHLSARVKQRLVKCYSSEICFGEVEGKKTYKSVCLQFVHFNS